MNENYLHFVWDKKRISAHDLKLVSGESLEILDFGKLNEHDGPDFLFGKIKIGRMIYAGHIEMHVNSSDWIVHKHQYDENYDNVILHVVYNHNRDIIQNNYKVPTIELKEKIDADHFNLYSSIGWNSSRVCQSMIREIDDSVIEQMKIKALDMKLSNKFNHMPFNSKGELLYKLFARSFGTSINREGFHQLIQKVPFQTLMGLTAEQKFKILLAESGVVQNRIPIERKQISIWKYKGTRPSNFPHIRVAQFAWLVANFCFDQLDDKPEQRYKFSNLLQEVESIFSMRNCPTKKMSRSFKNHLLINAWIPFLYRLGEKEKSINLLKELHPESNKVITKWKSCGIPVENAFDSQGLLALDRYYCCRKKCLSCSIGKMLLNRG